MYCDAFYTYCGVCHALYYDVHCALCCDVRGALYCSVRCVLYCDVCCALCCAVCHALYCDVGCALYWDVCCALYYDVCGALYCMVSCRMYMSYMGHMFSLTVCHFTPCLRIDTPTHLRQIILS